MYKEPITKDRLLKFTDAYSMVVRVPVTNDEPIFILKDLPNFKRQFRFLNQEIIIHKGKFIWKNKNKVPSSVLALRFTGEEYYIDGYKTCDDYPIRIGGVPCSSKEFSMHSILNTELKCYEEDLKPLRNLLKRYGIPEKVKQRNGKGNDALQDNIIEFTERETKDRKYIVRIGKKDLLIPYPEYLLLFVLARKRKQDIHGDGKVAYESLRRENIVNNLDRLHHLVSSLKECIGRKDLIENYLKTGKYRLAITPDRIKISSSKSTEQTFREIKKEVLKERRDREKSKKVRAEATKNA